MISFILQSTIYGLVLFIVLEGKVKFYLLFLFRLYLVLIFLLLFHYTKGVKESMLIYLALLFSSIRSFISRLIKRAIRLY